MFIARDKTKDKRDLRRQKENMQFCIILSLHSDAIYNLNTMDSRRWCFKKSTNKKIQHDKNKRWINYKKTINYLLSNDFV